MIATVFRSGKPCTMGRSSSSSTIGLCRTNKFISRVHASAVFRVECQMLEIKCLGWNGIRVLTRIRQHNLQRHDTILLDPVERIIVDICGERVRVQLIDDDETDEEQFVLPAAPQSAMPSDTCCHGRNDGLDTTNRLSRLPINRAGSSEALSFVSAFSTFDDSETAVADTSDATDDHKHTLVNAGKLCPGQKDGEPLEYTPAIDILGHHRIFIIAHLAYSRLASTPLSSIFESLPSKTITKDHLRQIIDDIPCIGVIHRTGKDASGKKLEEQYYYISERDDDEHRRRAVEELRGHPALRSCRKVHKQYYWKKPYQR
ncbi:uncharacterized protein V1510DRAFT_37269 [Dipodascopsis tothii]|uniref:uncharacterized protein n=1 Tax=Dipodascopsis tothii TaxID=44089 RepID=UPI0034CE33A4